ncbi:MAG: dTMP kinase [Bryobacterales bacterium]|nr:dTMP kinase [Bryobacterales bacterium]
MAQQPFLITFEGVDGSGKTTQLRAAAAQFRACGRQVLETAEPGGSVLGLEIRRILLDSGSRLTPQAELLLYTASRAQNIRELILPALAAGTLVLSDRFTDSTVAYQGYGRGLGAETVRELDALACGGLAPDVTVLLDLDPETALRRRAERNRMELEGPAFHQKVRAAYLEMAAREPERIRVIDGQGPAGTVAARVWDILKAYV